MASETKRRPELRIKLSAKCTGCARKWRPSAEEIAAAQDFGCLMCGECGSPATVELARASRARVSP